MQHRLSIKHLSGSRAPKLDRFTFPAEREIIFGRDRDCHVRYTEADDLVSRKHLKIVATAERPVRYLVVDLGSRNGTFVNRQRVFGATLLLPGGRVQLGAGGPEFEFGPDTVSARSRWPFAGASRGGMSNHLVKAASVLLLSGVAGAGGYQAWAKITPLWREWQSAEARRISQTGFTLAAAAASVVDVDAHWSVLDKNTGARLAQAYIANERTSPDERLPLIEGGPASLPVFVMAESRRIEPLLVPATSTHAGQIVEGKWRSKGVIVSEAGTVLTAAPRRQPWNTTWHWMVEETAGALLVLESQKVTQVVPLAAAQFPDWRPASSGFVDEHPPDNFSSELGGHNVSQDDLRVEVTASIHAGGRTWKTELGSQSPGVWLAPAQVESPLSGIPLPRLNGSPPKDNQRVWVVGNEVEPGEIRGASSDGLIALRSSHCSDGGIVFSRDGAVLALCIPDTGAKAGIAFAVPIHRVVALLSGSGNGLSQ
jgi:FHA domain